ncbi:MAG TPA: putative toxin-antitoxin system toxin component, PIN family [bacterium]
MIVTVDTNVIYSALYSNRGASHQILRLILDERVNLALSPPIFLEFYDVLSRKEAMAQLNLSNDEIEDILDILVLLAKKQAIYFLLRPNLMDEKDNIFYECAFATNSEYLITSNVRHFKSAELKGFRFKIVTPREFLSFMGV